MSPVLFISVLVFGVTSAQLTCLSGWTGPTSTGKCYRVMPGSTSPLDAGNLCKDNGGSLGSIKNQVEQDFVVNSVLPLARDWLITGLVRVPAGTGTWTWPDGTTAGNIGTTNTYPYQAWGTPASNPGIPAASSNYLYLYSHPSQKGQANYGKWWADGVVPHEVLCEAPGICLKSYNKGSCACNAGSN